MNLNSVAGNVCQVCIFFGCTISAVRKNMSEAYNRIIRDLLYVFPPCNSRPRSDGARFEYIYPSQPGKKIIITVTQIRRLRTLLNAILNHNELCLYLHFVHISHLRHKWKSLNQPFQRNKNGLLGAFRKRFLPPEGYKHLKQYVKIKFNFIPTTHL